MKITDNDKKLIEDTIKAAESKTSGEIVPVIIKQSDFYPAAHFRLALIFGVLFSIICYYTYDFLDPIILIWIQIPGMILGYLLGYIPFVKRLFITKSKLEEEVHQRAIEIYYDNKVSVTKDRTGIMIFVSLLERKVKVLADCGINEKVEKDFWDTLVQDLVSQIAKNNLTAGLMAAIETCGNKLKKSFPIQKSDINEVSDKLITD